MDSLAVSLLLCTRNRAEQLQICLEYIARQNPSCSWELVVVDNGSTDDTDRVLSEYAAKMPFPITILYEGRPGQRLGLNQALRVARGNIIALTDDDCYVESDYIDRVREIFEDPKIGYAGGRVDLFDPTDYPITIKTSTEPEYLPPRSYVEGGWILGANMMFRRSVLEAIGGFDPELGPGTRFYGDDIDAQARASFAGWWGFYAPTAVVAHHHRRKANDGRALMRIYCKGTGAYMAKFLLNPETRFIYLRTWFRSWYWDFWRFCHGRHKLRYLFNHLRNRCWEVQGAASYFAYRLRKRATGAS
jgi:glycosyltransferase involved in cell wall biosynthesis